MTSYARVTLAVLGVLTVTSGCSNSGSGAVPALRTPTAAASASMSSQGTPTSVSVSRPTSGTVTPQTSAALTPPVRPTTAPPSAVPTAATTAPSAPPTKGSDGIQEQVLAAIPGAKSGCVAVQERADVRSQSLAAGNFQQARKEFKAHEGPDAALVPLYVIPLNAKKMSQLEVTMIPLSGTGKSRVVRTSSVGTANTWSFYSLRLPVSAHGTWRLMMSTGADRGCFEVAFTQ